MDRGLNPGDRDTATVGDVIWWRGRSSGRSESWAMVGLATGPEFGGCGQDFTGIWLREKMPLTLKCALFSTEAAIAKNAG